VQEYADQIPADKTEEPETADQHHKVPQETRDNVHDDVQDEAREMDQSSNTVGAVYITSAESITNDRFPVFFPIEKFFFYFFLFSS
jgi:hypothetical protein